jgi:hypothetical protein
MKYLLAIALAFATPVFATEIVDYTNLCAYAGDFKGTEEVSGVEWLNRLVKEKIKQGWQPVGPMSISMGVGGHSRRVYEGYMYCQTLVKYKKDPIPTPTPTSTPTPSPGALP